MGARGRLTEFPERVPVGLSEAQKYRLEAIAEARGITLAGVVRYLIDKEWSEQHGCEASQDGPQEG
ncbi:hypothetical protein Aau02nite_78990 [Amorphoplanes auranticolor]|uniref:Uncharacterized protein n=1 Tax=Actinoplanes auranticolor TaxID=47988 RepID=A0A919SUV1_9ACTN|nr:hypothetical protein Aau02nite_78990 [Actinoplanes auranticolor]